MMSANSWLAHVERINPAAARLFHAATREAFLACAEEIIWRVVQRMERSRATFRKLTEPDLSHMVTEMVGELIPCEAERHQNGHVDVILSHPLDGNLRHITECKIWDGQQWHRSGMKQVLGYATGREQRVMVLEFFIHHSRMVSLLARLRRQLDDHPDPPALGRSEDHPELEGAFSTSHQHASGSRLGIVHLGCNLWEEGCDEKADRDDD